MVEFAEHHRTAERPKGFEPRSGELVAAKFAADGGWYRAKVRRSSAVKREAEVRFIDYGNEANVGFGDIRPLDERFRGLPGQAQDARLRYVCARVCLCQWCLW
jgi:staphylococcal nuclease domain-containing protein 1